VPVVTKSDDAGTMLSLQKRRVKSSCVAETSQALRKGSSSLLLMMWSNCEDHSAWVTRKESIRIKVFRGGTGAQYVYFEIHFRVRGR
jgi:hypothetical protein